jgi:hypothetical protein
MLEHSPKNQGGDMKLVATTAMPAALLFCSMSFATIKCESLSETRTKIVFTVHGSLSLPKQITYEIRQDDKLIFQSPRISVEEFSKGYIGAHLSGERIIFNYYPNGFSQFSVFDPIPRIHYPAGYHYYGETSSCLMDGDEFPEY